jgi:uncharacterized integral membrane protein
VQIYLLIAAIIAILAVIFALQNAIPITVTFLIWRVESSLALILIVAFIAGLVASFLGTALSRIRRIRTTTSQKKSTEETKKDTVTNQENEKQN